MWQGAHFARMQRRGVGPRCRCAFCIPHFHWSEISVIRPKPFPQHFQNGHEKSFESMNDDCDMLSQCVTVEKTLHQLALVTPVLTHLTRDHTNLHQHRCVLDEPCSADCQLSPAPARYKRACIIAPLCPAHKRCLYRHVSCTQCPY